MEEKDKMYFGHPVNFYNVPKEIELIKIIEKEFPSFRIENPNQLHHQEGYQKYKRETGRGMDYYFKEVLPKMKSGIFLSFEDRKFGAGVFGEAEFLKKRGKLIYELTLEGKIDFMPIDYSRMLSIEETRKRVYPNA
jgi:uncharacterized protein YqgQ